MTASTDRGSTNRGSPLGGWSARFAAASVSPAHFSIREVAFATQVNLRLDAALLGSMVRQALGCELPRTANTWNAGDDCAVLWLGPDEWLVVAPDGRSETLCAALRSALSGAHHSVVDLSASRKIIEIAGSDARVTLAKGCPLDLHGSAFRPPQCAQTLLAKSQMILQCIEARPAFRVFVRASFAPYVAEWLLDAAVEQRASRDAGMLGLHL